MKKAQIWGMDLMVAIMIFTLGIITFYMYTINSPYNHDEGYVENSKLLYEGEIVADSLLSEGIPSDWNNTNVVKIGLLSNGQINQTKLERFYDLARDFYPKTKYLFNTNYEYFFALQERVSIYGIEYAGIGKSGTDIDNIPSKDVIKINRFTVYNNKPMTASVYLWRSNG